MLWWSDICGWVWYRPFRSILYHLCPINFSDFEGSIRASPGAVVAVDNLAYVVLLSCRG